MKNLYFLPFVCVFILTVTTNCYCQDTSSAGLYFPSGTFDDPSIYENRDNFINTWYSKNLSALKEPVLFIGHPATEIYRFTWLRSFHHPVAIRIEKKNDKYNLYWKVCNGAAGYEPGRLIANETKEIDSNTWNTFKAMLVQIDFWNLKTNEISFGSDGAQWVLEGRKNEQYHVVDRWTPHKDSKYFQCCDFLIKLTGMKIKQQDKY